MDSLLHRQPHDAAHWRPVFGIATYVHRGEPAHQDDPSCALAPCTTARLTVPDQLTVQLPSGPSQDASVCPIFVFPDPGPQKTPATLQGVLLCPKHNSSKVKSVIARLYIHPVWYENCVGKCMLAESPNGSASRIGSYGSKP